MFILHGKGLGPGALGVDDPQDLPFEHDGYAKFGSGAWVDLNVTLEDFDTANPDGLPGPGHLSRHPLADRDRLRRTMRVKPEAVGGMWMQKTLLFLEEKDSAIIREQTPANDLGRRFDQVVDVVHLCGDRDHFVQHR